MCVCNFNCCIYIYFFLRLTEPVVSDKRKSLVLLYMPTELLSKPVGGLHTQYVLVYFFTSRYIYNCAYVSLLSFSLTLSFTLLYISPQEVCVSKVDRI